MAWTENELDRIFDKAKFVSEENEKKGFRKDVCEAWIQRSQHGNTKSPYGWQVDHIKPDSKGGSDDIGNLRPLHWKNNQSRQAGKLDCVVTSNGNQNVEKGKKEG